MKRMGAFGFFLLFLAGIAIVNLRNMADQTSASIKSPDIADLSGRPWQLLRLVDEQPSPDASFDISFGDDMTVSVRAACNRFHGNFAYSEGRFELGELAGTRRACEADIMQADTLVLQALATTRLLSLAGQRLLLKSADDTLIAVLHRQAAESTTSGTITEETSE